MANKKKKSSSNSSPRRWKVSFSLTKQQKVILGSFLFLFGVGLLVSFISFFLNWQADQSIVGDMSRELEPKNWLSSFGNNLGYLFVYNGSVCLHSFLLFWLLLRVFIIFWTVQKMPY